MIDTFEQEPEDASVKGTTADPELADKLHPRKEEE